ncbi:hypothetical protein [Cryobacterium zhongshanensis]|uniref:SH3 domain-containing protein n=1 Tax=Cryobacterium zhongshanensis TaxID=2928153 RepID=A0AA41QZ33_9MICO|nr:hypothetical protein [Cryobacterium zhongshanensis]MCI4659744.1 hypothetical protein [Cryobacterium zhongshanensis]
MSTIGAGATVRDCYHPVQWPSTNCPKVTFLPKGTAVHIICQRVGDLVYGTYGSSEVWDYVSVTVSGQTYEGLVADVNVYTGSNGLVADVCS